MTGWADDALTTLAAAGFRRGGARTAVIELLDRQACALSAQEVAGALGEEASRASVYRVLDQLVEHGLAARVEVGQGITRYEPVREGGHHHHLVCDRCGRVLPFHDDELERAIGGLARRVAFDVAEHEITLRGVCAECR